MKPVLYIVALTFAFLIAVFAYDKVMNPPLGNNFTLIDSNGKKVTQEDIRKQPSVVFFGYTRCPDICPNTLFSLNLWLSELGEDANKIAVWFITVDPERDTPEVMHDYLYNFSNKEKLTGISGDPKAVHDLVASFNIAAQKVDGEDGDYTYDHTAAILLLKKGGTLSGVIPYGFDEENNALHDEIAVERLKKLANQ